MTSQWLILRLFDGALVLVFEGLHLLLLLVASVDGFSNRATHWTSNILAPMVVAEDVARTDAVGDQTLLIFAFRNVLP